MNKVFKELVASYGFTENGNVASGFHRGYQVALIYDSVQPCSMFIFTHMDAENTECLQTYLKENRKDLKLVNWQFSEAGCHCIIRSVTAKSCVSNIQHAMEEILNFLTEKGFSNAESCPLCGNPLTDPVPMDFGGVSVRVDSACMAAEEKKSEEEELAYQAAPNNYLRGTVGALIGGAIGAVAWVLIGLLGFVSGWVAVLISYLAGKGYDKAKGKPNAMKIVISSVITLVLIVVSMFVLYTITVSVAMAQENLEGNPLVVLFQLIDIDEEFKQLFISDFVSGLVFGVIGLGIGAWEMRKTLHKSK